MGVESFIAAADTANIQAGGTSIFEDIGNIATKGVAGAVVSGWHGLLNTGVDLSNKVFGTELERADTLETLNNIDVGYGDYYKQNKATIDIAGFVAGSLVPGTLAVKGLKAIQAGEGAGVFSRALGYAASKERAYLNAALDDLATAGGNVFQRINTNKLASMAWGTADQALQVAAFETATALSMKASPLLDNEDWKHIGWDVLTTSLAGGVVGGGLNALFTNKLVKDAGKLVEGKQRMFDVLKDTGNINLTFGDKAYGIVDAVLALPKEALDPVIKLGHNLPGIKKELDITGLLDKTGRESVARGVQKLETALMHVVENDKSVGEALASSFVGILKDGLQDGVSDTVIRAKLGEYLLNLAKVEGIGSKSTAVAGEVHYFPKLGTQVKGLEGIGSTSPREGFEPFRVMSKEEPKIGVLGKDGVSFKEAFGKGFDAVLDPTTKQVRINPSSNVYQRITDDDANLATIFFNTVTRQTSADIIPTIGDVRHLKEVEVNAAGVSSGSKTFAFRTGEGSFQLPADSVEATARHLWADELRRIHGQIDSRDISLLDALLKDANKLGDDFSILDRENGTVLKMHEIGDFRSYVFQQKYNLAIHLLEKAGPNADLRDIAYRLNVTGDWIESAISTKFTTRDAFQHPGWQVNPQRYKQRENLIMSYNKTGMANAAGAPEASVAYAQRVKEATERAQLASKAVLGEEYDKLIRLEKSLASDATSEGVGASGFGASNAGYADRLKAWAQYTGQIVGNLVNKRTSESLATLQSYAARLVHNPQAAAEVAAAVTKLRLTGKSYGLYTDGLTGKIGIADLSTLKSFQRTGQAPSFAPGQLIWLSKDAGDFIAAHHKLHGQRVKQQNVLSSAQGFLQHHDPDRLYFPPVDTQRVPFFAFVRKTDGSIFGSSEVAMITARNAAELQALAAQVEKRPGLSVIYKANTEDYHKAKRDYDFGRAMNSPMIDATLRKEGALGDYLPNMTPEAIIEDFVNFTLRGETKLVRDAVGANYAQTFAELKDLSDRYTAGQTSKFEGLSRLLQKGVTDPFDDAIKLAMNISKRSEFTLWHEANEFVDALGTRAFQAIEKATLDARSGKIDWQEANQTLQRFGIGAPFTDEAAFAVAQRGGDRNLIKIALQKANMLVTTGMLRLDLANSLLNIVSTPILLGTEVSAIKNSLRTNPELFANLSKQLSEQVPGTTLRIPSTTRLLANAVGATLSDEGKVLMKRFRDIGTVKGPVALYHDMIGDLSLTPNLIPSKYAAAVDSWVEKGAMLTGSNLAEDYTRFVTSHVMWQITEPVVKAGRMSVQEQNAFISIFTNRVQGNYIASQRPIAFQGTIGSAVGLFQTYQFNLFQQLFRHIENKDAKTLAVMAGLQGSLFGLNGLPFFQAVNTHLIGNANINENHSDAYSYAVKAVGKEWGDWMMYGTASAFPLFSEQAPALWTRGDLNPRSAFILPTSPMDVPAVQASIKAINALVGMAQQVSKGGSVQDALLFGLEHNGINRPLAGLAQQLSGQSTTSKGNLIAAAGDWASISTFSRLIGAKPMDESIAVTTLYRSRAYQAVDKDRIDALGGVIKQKLRNNEPISEEDWIDLQGQYAAAGGKIQGFTQAMQRWAKASNTSVVNEVMRHSQSVAGQRMIEVLGGDPLRDYRLNVEE